MPAAFAVNWTEYERGWGSRPDGHTLHVSKELAEKFVEDYWAKMPDDVPDEYSSPSPVFHVDVDQETMDRLSVEGSFWGHPTRQLPMLRMA